MKRLIAPFVVSALLLAFNARAQQDPLYSQYFNNPFVINPAYAGLKDNLVASLNYRQQWVGLEGNAATINASGHISLRNNTMGSGLMVVSDRIGPYSTNEVLASYSYRIEMVNGTRISFGLQAGASNYRVDNDKVNVYDQGDPLFTGRQSEFAPVFGAGAILVSDKYFIGLSVPRMLKSSAEVNGMRTDLYSQHYYLMGSWLMYVSEKLWFKPSALVKYVAGAPLSTDLTASVILSDRYQAGLLTRNFNTYGMLLQAVISDTFAAGYVFELPTGKSVGTNFTTHELSLTLRLNVLREHISKSALGF